jgi:hypothetical protein
MNRPQIYHSTEKKTVAVSPKYTWFDGMTIEQSKEAREIERQRTIEEQHRIIGERIKTIKNLAYATLAGNLIPRGRARCIDLYHASLPKLRELGRKGGQDYNHAVALLKYTWISPKNFQETEGFLLEGSLENESLIQHVIDRK